ncbi:MAG: N-acetylmuramic acid 6-phosphate etherase [Ruminococcaceae bacterium]|nr:N-acetylmuramic acid 6-phosphate etherase [Oscillospiraceae bacterium]
MQQSAVRTDLQALKTEGRNQNTLHIDKLATIDMVTLMNNENRVVEDAIATQLPEIAQAVDIIAKRLDAGSHLIYIGAGTSGRLGVVDASECPPTFGVDPRLVRGIMAGGEGAMFRAVEGAEDDEVRGAEELLADGVTAGDVVVGLSASGGAPYVLGALKKAREIGAIPLGITCNPDSRMHAVCDVTIAPYVGPEVITGSSRLKAGTAQKLVLNMLSTGAMIKTGKVVGNLMVNVRPTNVKLRDRCIRILMELGNCDRATAEPLIDQYGDIKKSLEALKSKEN